jgi:acetoacetyl-CoA synthetase
MSKLLWQPSIEQIANSNMTQFIKAANATYQTDITDYTALYQWSINYPEQFWPLVWKFCHIKASKLWDEVLIREEEMPGAAWFVGSELNFAENLLQYRDSKNTALIFHGENGARRSINYQELYQQVMQLASALRKSGVTIGDRVAGWMPNCIETVVAMLATTSIGAVWSSCSPDFGVHGVLDRFGQINPKVLFTVEGYFYNGKCFDQLEKITELQKQLPSLEKLIVVPFTQSVNSIKKPNNSIFYHEFLDQNATILEFEQLLFEHPVYVMFSSGTTGVPKCIVHGAGGTLLQHQKELVLHTDLTAQDTICYFTTCGWMMWNWLVSSLATGATLVLYDGSPFYPNPAAMFDLIDSEKITVYGTGAKYIATVEKNGTRPIETHKLNSLRAILSTASPLLPENFAFVYRYIKQDLCLSSISGGTDIISCFALGNPILPVYSGELQCRGLGMKVEVFNEQGKPVIGEKGELVCTAPFPCMPIYFWNDPENEKYHKAYFARFPNVWAHGDYAEITEHDGMIIYGRSDATLNPGGIRIGTAEIYREVEKINEVIESIAVGQEWQDDTRIILFVRLREGVPLTDELKNKIKKNIRQQLSPRHVPAKIIAVVDIPRTVSGKIMELAVRNIVQGEAVKNIDAIANPESLNYFKDLQELND